MLLWANDELSEQLIKNQYEYLLGSNTENAVYAFFAGKNMQEITYETVFEIDGANLRGILFPEKYLVQCGPLNSKLTCGELYEFLCRLMQTAEICYVQEIEDTQTNTWSKEEYGFIYAYIIRYHMQNLRQKALLDTVFQKVCLMLQKKECFIEFQRILNSFMTDESKYEALAIMTAPFLILRGNDTCGGVLQKFAEDLAESLKDNGQAVIVVGNDLEQYDKIQNGLYKGLVGFQTKALEIDFFKKMHGLKFQFWLDYPLRFKGIMRALPEEYYILCQDEDYATQIRDYFHTANAIQFPPGGVNPKKPIDFSDERPYDIVFMGTNFEDEVDVLVGEHKEYYDFMCCHSNLNFEDGLCEFLQIEKDDSYQESFIEKMQELKPACRAVIAHFRKMIIQTILESGYDIHVYGDSWKFFDDKEYAGKLIIHPLVSVEDSLEELKKAKIGLNIMSWHKAGMTERVANIMLSGAVCLSEETKFLKESLSEDEEIVLFGLNELSKLPQKIEEILGNEEKRLEIAKKGYEKAVQDFSWDARAKEIIKLAEGGVDSKEKICIFVATHVAFNPPNNPIYMPIHVGRHGKKDLGYMGDDTGVNISDLNFLYGELTGLFWVWQNAKDLDYAGLCHYRRYFINEEKKELQRDEYLSILHQYDAIVPKHMECLDNCTYYEQFCRAHNQHDLDAVERALKKLYPEYGDAYDQAMSGHIFYYGNLMVTHMSILRAYAEWLFTIFIEAGEEIDVSGYDDYHKRVFGFLSEQMFYVFALANNLKLYEVSVGISAEKAETKELKEMLRQLIKENKLLEARKIFDRQLAIRPDLLLPGSDINNELNEIYEQLK